MNHQVYKDEIFKITFDLKNYCKTVGADLIGIANLDPLRKKLPFIPKNLIDKYYYGISIGVRLKDEVIEEIIDCPTPKYAQEYKNINSNLDWISSLIVQWLTKNRFKGKSIPASFIADEKNLLGNISHKAVANMAGLGWQGKSLLIINPEYGPRLRLATILTDMPLIPDQPIKNRCGNCIECVKACPALAIKNTSTYRHYSNIRNAVDLEKCHTKLLEFKNMADIGSVICGVCIKVCPYGNRKK